jgi:hypothetical protein
MDVQEKITAHNPGTFLPVLITSENRVRLRYVVR